MAKIEQRSIDYIPTSERHGKVRSLFYLWFGINLTPLTISTGAVLVMGGLSFSWSVLAIIIGNILATLLMAAHSAQGPHLGVPQMIQSRAQFGVFGAVIPLIMVFCMYLGYASSATVYAPEMIMALFPDCPIPFSGLIFICTAITAFVVIVGYDAIHVAFKYITWIMGALFLIVTICLFTVTIPEGVSLGFGEFNLGLFLFGISIPASWQACYAPYVADYSRYLPEDTKTSHTFWTTYMGACLGAIWMMIVGCFLAAAVPAYAENQMAGLASVFPWPTVFLVISFVFMILGSTLNLYGLFMSITTILEPFTNLKVTTKVRVIFISLGGVLVWLIGSYAGENFWAFYTNFLAIILYFLIPWTSINLVDFYFIRHGHYSVDALSDPKGMYKAWNGKTLVIYFLTVLIEIPFVSQTFYVGPIAELLGGGEIAWIVGGIFAAVVYYLANRNEKIAKDAPKFQND